MSQYYQDAQDDNSNQEDDRVLDLINKVQMFQIVVGKVNQRKPVFKLAERNKDQNTSDLYNLIYDWWIGS